MLESINRIVFGMFLLSAAWQDGRKKSIHIWLFGAAGIVGLILSLKMGELGVDRFLSCLIGAGLLLLSFMSDGAIGTGDGFFFVVSGLFLRALLNLKLLVYGILLNGIICGGIYLHGRILGSNVKKMTVPFLPFLVPVWIGLVVL